MDALTSPSLIPYLLRWAHIVFGIIWIGHLYFFNLVNVPFQGGLDKELKPKVNPALLLRAFYWFRWGAMYTLIFGLALFVWHYIAPEHNMRDEAGAGERSHERQATGHSSPTTGGRLPPAVHAQAGPRTP